LASSISSAGLGGGRLRRVLQSWELYVLFLPTFLYYVIFHYGPMYGVQIAFKDFIAIKGIMGSPWVGLKHFARFFRSFEAWNIIRNTLVISLYQVVFGFPVPFLLAILLNQLNSRRYKRIVQTVTYAPHFISIVVLVGMMHVFLSPRTGLVNQALRLVRDEPVFFMGKSQWFRPLFVLSGIWQNAGWQTIIYLAALSAVDPSLHEAAIVDGAGKLQRILHIEIPSILPTAVILLILRLGRVMSLGFEKAFLMQNPLNLETSEIISTYVYKVGLLGAQYSFSAAVGLFNAVINLTLLVAVNRLSRILTKTSLW
jgi:putative aldouronate transport system permease protein